MNLRLKRAKELAGYAVQLTRDEGLGTMMARGAGFVKRRFFGKKPATCPPKRYWKPSGPRWPENVRGLRASDHFRPHPAV